MKKKRQICWSLNQHNPGSKPRNTFLQLDVWMDDRHLSVTRDVRSTHTRGPLGEVGGEEAQRLALVGGQGWAVSFEVAWDAAAGGAGAVAEGLDAALPLQLCTDTTQSRALMCQRSLWFINWSWCWYWNTFMWSLFMCRVCFYCPCVKWCAEDSNVKASVFTELFPLWGCLSEQWWCHSWFVRTCVALNTSEHVHVASCLNEFLCAHAVLW